MMRHVLTPFLFVLLCLISACDDTTHPLSQLAMVINPTLHDTIEVNAGGYVKYSISYHNSNGGRVRNLTVSSFDQMQGQKVLLDRSYSDGETDDTYIYQAPQATRDTLLVTLTFSAIDSEGADCVIKRYVRVCNQQVLLDERGPIVLYLAEGRRDAFCFADPTQTFDHVHSADSARADLFVDVDEAGGIVIRSNTKAKFVRYNDYDYASATAVGMQTVFASSRRDDGVAGLSANDIVLVGHGDQAEGALFVSNVIRQNDDTDCVHLSFKGLK